MAETIYLDYAAATPVDDAVLAAMLPFYQQQFYNPSATYLPAKAVHEALSTARGQVAHWLGTRPTNLIFTAGGTEANNLAIHGIMQQYPDGNLVVSAIEHESVLAPASQYDHQRAQVLPDGTIDLAALAAMINDQTVLVSIMYANNEIGTIQPLAAVAQLLERIRHGRGSTGRPLYLHSDACQATNYLHLHVDRLGVDLMTINGGKIYGPKQSGALYVSSRVALSSRIQGGGQERNLRSGTENVAQAIGLATALDLVQADRQQEVSRQQSLQADFIQALTERIPAAVINGAKKSRLPNNVHVTLPGFDNERVLIQLEQQGILAAAGSACSASNEAPSHVLKALGLSDEAAQASLRFTFGRSTTADQLKTVSTSLAELVAS